MKLSIPVSYPVTPAVLLRALTDRAFHEAKIKGLKTLRHEILESSVGANEFSIRVRRTMRNEAAVPALLKKLVPEFSVIEHHDRWNTKTGTGAVDIRIEGIPVSLNCTITALAQGASTELRHDWNIQCRLPVVGGALERFLAADLPRLMEQEAAAGRPLLGRYT